MKLCVAASFGLIIHASTAATCTTETAEPVEQLIKYGSGGGDAAILTQAHGLIGGGIDALHRARYLLISRDHRLTCNGGEMCLSLAGVPFCYDASTGDYCDGDGTTGNAISGDYKLTDGQEGNLYTGPYPMPTSNGEASLTVDGLMSTVTLESMPKTTQIPTQVEISSTIALTQTTVATATDNAAAGFRASPMLQKLLAVEVVALWYGVL